MGLEVLLQVAHMLARAALAQDRTAAAAGRCPRGTEGQATVAVVGLGVGVGAAGPDLEVQVGPGRGPGRSDIANVGAGADAGPFGDAPA